ncbi:MAG: tRNA (adenosine(37)-N6)-threonylcarbamoyltransferase complex ATPase subunit type 1 TsaE [Burkholderiales bacterium]
MKNLSRHLADESATQQLGRELLSCLVPGMTIYLRGNLGAGKTSLVRGMLQGLGFHGKVKSPTYTLVEPYEVSHLYLYHFDFYRFVDPEEWIEAGLRDYFNADNVCLVEWPEKAGDLLPTPDLTIELHILPDGRRADIQALSARAEKCLQAVQIV